MDVKPNVCAAGIDLSKYQCWDVYASQEPVVAEDVSRVWIWGKHE